MPPAYVFVVVLAGVLGLFVGSFLNIVAYRVPARLSLLSGSRCPQCDAPVSPWESVPVVSWVALRGRCANCRAPISARHPLVEAVTGLAFAGVTWLGLLAFGPAAGSGVGTSGTGAGSGSAQWWALALVIVAYLSFAATGIVLTLIDLDTHRLPNSIVLPSYVVAGILFTIAAGLTGDWTALLRAVVGMAALYVFYFTLRLARPGGMGGGDVKLAGVIGLHLGWLGWGALAVGAFAAFLLGGLFGIALMLARRAGRKTAIPFGPWMILGAWVGILAGESLGRWYLRLFAGG